MHIYYIYIYINKKEKRKHTSETLILHSIN